MVDKSGIDIDELQKMRDAHAQYTALLRWLAQNRSSLFARKDAKDYLVATGCRSEDVLFFADKKEALEFRQEHPIAAWEYRYADQMEFLL